MTQYAVEVLLDVPVVLLGGEMLDVEPQRDQPGSDVAQEETP